MSSVSGLVEKRNIKYVFELIQPYLTKDLTLKGFSNLIKTERKLVKTFFTKRNNNVDSDGEDYNCQAIIGCINGQYQQCRRKTNGVNICCGLHMKKDFCNECNITHEYKYEHYGTIDEPNEEILEKVNKINPSLINNTSEEEFIPKYKSQLEFDDIIKLWVDSKTGYCYGNDSYENKPVGIYRENNFAHYH
jgi:hypothetical protein